MLKISDKFVMYFYVNIVSFLFLKRNVAEQKFHLKQVLLSYLHYVDQKYIYTTFR